MEKTISTNQASLILCIFTIALKLSALPALMFTYSGNDSYIACFIAVGIDFLCTLILTHIMHKNPEKTFFNLIKETMGKTIAIIIQIILLIYFLFKAILVLQELHDYFIATLFEDLNPVFFLIVLSLLILYTTTKNFRTIGRVIQLIFWPTVIGIGFTLIFPIKDLQIEKLFPIFEQGLYPIYRGLSRTTFAFGDFMILLPMMGHIVLDGKKSKKYILNYMFATCGFIFNFFIIFVGSFGKFGQSQTLALAELPLHNTTPATIGKLEWLTIIIWTIILLVDGIVLCIATRSCFDNIFGTSVKNLGTIVITCIVTIIIALTYMQLESILQLIVEPWFSAVAGFTQLGLLILIITASCIQNKKTKSNTLQKQNKRKLQC